MDNPNFEPRTATATIIFEKNDIKEEDQVSKVDKAPNPTTTSLNVQIPDNQQRNVFTIPTVEAPIYNTTIVSALAMCLVSPKIRGAKQSVPSFVITGTSLIYSLFSLFVTVIWKNQKNIEKLSVLKKIFAGRNIFWHEIHSSMTLMLAFANLSCIVFFMWQPRLNVILSLINTLVFGCEFFLTVKTAKTFAVEEHVPKCNCKITIAILGLFKRHPIKFNVLQLHTYLSLGITIHAFLTVLTNSLEYSPISLTISCVIFVLSLLDLYSQAIFNKSRPINESQNPLLVKAEQKYPFRNLPTTIENPLGIEGVKEVYGY
uniref:Transmembrane protein n=1 Tax=Panagrolaimus sp. ES5 TaxID=591445 RepID=A0AC34EZY5_9BILA